MKSHTKLAARIKTKSGTIHDSLTGYDFRKDERLTPLRTIRAKCLECQCGSSQAVKECEIHDCPNFPWRSGKTGRKNLHAVAPKRTI